MPQPAIHTFLSSFTSLFTLHPLFPTVTKQYIFIGKIYAKSAWINERKFILYGDNEHIRRWFTVRLVAVWTEAPTTTTWHSKQLHHYYHKDCIGSDYYNAFRTKVWVSDCWCCLCRKVSLYFLHLSRTNVWCFLFTSCREKKSGLSGITVYFSTNVLMFLVSSFTETLWHWGNTKRRIVTSWRQKT